MPASAMAARTPAAIFSIMAGRPMSSGKMSSLSAAPMASRDSVARPVSAVRMNRFTCGQITPSQPPDHTIGMASISAAVRAPAAARTRR